MKPCESTTITPASSSSPTLDDRLPGLVARVDGARLGFDADGAGQRGALLGLGLGSRLTVDVALVAVDGRRPFLKGSEDDGAPACEVLAGEGDCALGALRAVGSDDDEFTVLFFASRRS